MRKYMIFTSENSNYRSSRRIEGHSAKNKKYFFIGFLNPSILRGERTKIKHKYMLGQLVYSLFRTRTI